MADDASPTTRPQPTAETEASPPPADGKAKARRKWLTRLFILLVVAGGAGSISGGGRGLNILTNQLHSNKYNFVSKDFLEGVFMDFLESV